jgi:RHS repeat-associated protein
LIGSIVSDSGATYTPGVSERRGTTSTFYHADIKNSVEQTSTSQSVVASKQYDAFGNEVSSQGPWQGPFQYGGAFGYHTDSDYGLKHLGARYYDSTTGRFLSRDPIKDGRNWYAYCDDRSVHLADPWGLVMMSVVLEMCGFGPPRERKQRKAVVVFGGVPWWDRLATAVYRHWWSSFFVDQWRKRDIM